MINDTASSNFTRQDPRAQERTRRTSQSRDAPAVVAARRRLRKVAQDLRRNRQELAALAHGLRTTKPALGDSSPHPDVTALSVEEWAADCTDAVADGLVGLAELAETGRLLPDQAAQRQVFTPRGQVPKRDIKPGNHLGERSSFSALHGANPGLRIQLVEEICW